MLQINDSINFFKPEMSKKVKFLSKEWSEEVETSLKSF
jgi:hypothetical protein